MRGGGERGESLQTNKLRLNFRELRHRHGSRTVADRGSFRQNTIGPVRVNFKGK